MYDVICTGSATIDVFAVINHKFSACHPGEKILVDDLNYFTGGGGTNTAVSLSRLGIKSAFLGKVGKDHNGDLIIKELKKEKVSVIPVTRAKKKTSFSVILLSKKERDRIIYTYKGSSNDLGIDDFSMKSINAKWLYLATFLGKAFHTAERAVIHAKKNGSKILFNPSEYLASQPALLKNILQNTDVLVLNKLEAQLLTKTKKDVASLASIILKKGPKAVIITDGPRGAHYFEHIIHRCIVPPKVKVISTAGAGDAFTSAFLAGLIEGKNVDTCLKMGTVNASSVIQHYGTKTGLLTGKQMAMELKKRKRELICK
jgi:sugar/nucleoside kinase (ribokinase family)